MAPTPRSARGVSNPLDYLPRRKPVGYRRGANVYSAGQPANALHFIAQGAVNVSIVNEHDGHSILLDIYREGDFFGESCLLGLRSRCDAGVCLERSLIMSWTYEEIAQRIDSEPLLALALIRLVVSRGLDTSGRIEALALDKVPERLARSLLRFAERIGVPESDGSTRIPPLTHQTIAHFVSTSRELVTFNLLRLRRRGLIRYSRKGINIDTSAVREWLGIRRDGARVMAASWER